MHDTLLDFSGAPLSHQKEIVRTFYQDMWNRTDAGLVPDIFHPDFTFRGSLGPTLVGHINSQKPRNAGNISASDRRTPQVPEMRPPSTIAQYEARPCVPGVWRSRKNSRKRKRPESPPRACGMRLHMLPTC